MTRSIVVAFLLLVGSANASDACYTTAKSVHIEGDNDEWVSTGIKIRAGDLVVISAEGKIKIGSGMLGDIEVGPNGSPIGTGRLEAKIGTTLVSIGAKWFAGFDQDSGALKLRVRDTNYADNAGRFQVLIYVIPGCAFPPIEVIDSE